MVEDPGEQPQGPLLVELGYDECIALMSSRTVGRLGFVDEQDQPTILPVNHAVVDGQVVFRSAAGSKLDLAVRHAGARVAFEVDDFDDAAETGWSVVVSGAIEPVLDSVKAAKLARVGHHAWLDRSRDQWLAITAADVTGRRIERI